MAVEVEAERPLAELELPRVQPDRRRVPEVEDVDQPEELDDVDLPRVVVVDHPELGDHLLLGRLLAAARGRHQLVEGRELGELVRREMREAQEVRWWRWWWWWCWRWRRWRW